MRDFPCSKEYCVLSAHGNQAADVGGTHKNENVALDVIGHRPKSFYCTTVSAIYRIPSLHPRNHLNLPSPSRWLISPSSLLSTQAFYFLSVCFIESIPVFKSVLLRQFNKFWYTSDTSNFNYSDSSVTMSRVRSSNLDIERVHKLRTFHSLNIERVHKFRTFHSFNIVHDQHSFCINSRLGKMDYLATICI